MTARRAEAIARVAARLREETARLSRIVGALEAALMRWGEEPQEPPTIHWVGGLIHDFYTGLEKAFAEISPALNDRPAGTDAWHRDLLHTMTLDIPGFRPPVLRAELEIDLAEMLRFRHLYRNLYSFDLKWDRVRALGRRTLDLWPTVRDDLTAFARRLDELTGG